MEKRKREREREREKTDEGKWVYYAPGRKAAGRPLPREGPNERSLNVKKLIIRVEAAEAASGSGKTNTATE